MIYIKGAALLFALGLLSGCRYYIDSTQLTRFEAMCKDHGGLYKVEVQPPADIYCVDGQHLSDPVRTY